MADFSTNIPVPTTPKGAMTVNNNANPGNPGPALLPKQEPSGPGQKNNAVSQVGPAMPMPSGNIITSGPKNNA